MPELEMATDHALVLVEHAEEIETREQEAAGLLETANLFRATSAVTYETGIETARELRHRRKEVVAFFRPMRDPAHKAWKAICARQAQVEKPLVEAIGVYELEIGRYVTEQQLIADRRAATDRARAEAEAKAAREAAFDEAAEAGDDAKAEAILDNVDAEVAVSPEASAAAQVEAAAPKVKNVVTRKVWTGEVVDIRDFLIAVAEGKAPAQLIAVDKPALNRFAAQTQGTVAVPGVKFAATEKVTVRS